jgi:Arc/MetJ family transcription regulator
MPAFGRNGSHGNSYEPCGWLFVMAVLQPAWILSPNGAIFDASSEELIMRSTINLDDTLIEKARFLTGTKETAALVRQALETLVRVESGKRLIALGGTMPDAEAAPRRRGAKAK